MRRFKFIAVVGVAGLIALPVACAFSQEPQPGTLAPAQKKIAPGQRAAQDPVPGAGNAQGAELLEVLLGAALRTWSRPSSSEWRLGANPLSLTLEQAYSLTLIRAQIPPACEPCAVPISLIRWLWTMRPNAQEPLISIGFAGSFSRPTFGILRMAF